MVPWQFLQSLIKMERKRNVYCIVKRMCCKSALSWDCSLRFGGFKDTSIRLCLVDCRRLIPLHLRISGACAYWQCDWPSERSDVCVTGLIVCCSGDDNMDTGLQWDLIHFVCHGPVRSMSSSWIVTLCSVTSTRLRHLDNHRLYSCQI